MGLARGMEGTHQNRCIPMHWFNNQILSANGTVMRFFAEPCGGAEERVAGGGSVERVVLNILAGKTFAHSFNWRRTICASNTMTYQKLNVKVYGFYHYPGCALLQCNMCLPFKFITKNKTYM